MDLAVANLLALSGLRKFHNALKTDKEKDDFRKHLRRYAQIYLPDCPFEVSTTNRYTIVTYEAAVTARRFIKRGESIKYLSGIQVVITPQEEEEMTKRKKDFSIVVSSRNKCASLFMGPARFANHDCDANARLVITSQSTIEIFASKNIEQGDEITVTYGENYFGEDNCECLCQTCERNLANGWAQPEGEALVSGLVQNSIEDTSEEGYRLRRRRRDDSTARSSRTPSRTPDIRPRVSRSRTKLLRTESSRASMTGSPAPEALLRHKRKRNFEMLSSPPNTPAKRQKSAQIDDAPIPAPSEILRKGSEDAISGLDSTGSAAESTTGESTSTEVTTPDEEMQESVLALRSPRPTPKKPLWLELNHDDEDFIHPSNVIGLLLPPRESTTSGYTTSIRAAPATGIPTADIPETSTEIDMIPPAELNLVVLPPPLTPASGLGNSSQIIPTPGSDHPETSDIPIKRGRGRPKGSTKARKLADRAAVRSEEIQTGLPDTIPQKKAKAHLLDPASDVDEEPPGKGSRRPGDYTLTPLLLAEADSAWIRCLVCDASFVQKDAYYTRVCCPRCERHSKLYGYQWPKTQKEGKHDKEERILDHREIHRFLDPQEEARVRGRKYLGVDLTQQVEVKKIPHKTTPKFVKTKRSPLKKDVDEEYRDSDVEEDGNNLSNSARRSKRERMASIGV